MLEKEQLEGELGSAEAGAREVRGLVADYLGKLRQIEGQTKAMESKKDAMIAKLHSAQARKAFDDMVSGMSTSAEEAAVGDMDKHIEGLAAQADIGEEMAGATREEKRRKLREAAPDAHLEVEVPGDARVASGRRRGPGRRRRRRQKVVEGKGGIG